jgi:hypothetical protein
MRKVGGGLFDLLLFDDGMRGTQLEGWVSVDFEFFRAEAVASIQLLSFGSACGRF